jgi:hypothetical protein
VKENRGGEESIRGKTVFNYGKSKVPRKILKGERNDLLFKY